MKKAQTGTEYILITAFGIIAVIIVLALARGNIWPEAKYQGNQSAATVNEFLNQAGNNTGSAPATISVQLVSPADAGFVPAGTIEFVFSPVNFTSLFNATLYGDFNGTWLANQTTDQVSFGVNRFYLPLPAGGPYTWNVEVCDYAPAPNCSFAPANYTVTVT